MFRLSNSVRNVLQASLGKDRAEDPEYLGSLEPETIQDMRRLGNRGVFDLSVALIASRHWSQPDEVWPTWLKKIGPSIKPEAQYADDEEAALSGMVRLTHRYQKKEWYELMRACADLYRGGIEFGLMEYGVRSERGLAIARTSQGLLAVEADPEDKEESDEQG